MPQLIAVMGPTASGKTEYAEALADRLDAVLVNGDAFQVYRGMDIGTAKPTNRARYKLLDIKNPDESFGVGEWVSLAHSELAKAFESGRNVIVAGGAGLYIRALFDEYSDLKPSPSPELRAALMERERTEGLASLVTELRRRAPEVIVDEANPVRVRRALERLDTPASLNPRPLPPFKKEKHLLEVASEVLGQRIEHRVRQMIDIGWLDEVAKLRSEGYSAASPGFRAIGYRELLGVVTSDIPLDSAILNVIRATNQYAKRQRTWLRAEKNAILIPA